MVVCRFCGQPNESGTKFCSNCGMYQWNGGDQPPPPEARGREQPQPRERPSRPERASDDEEERPAIRIISGRADRESQRRAGGGGERVAVEDRPGPQAEPSRAEPRQQRGRIAVSISLAASELEVEPPNLVTCEIRVRNAGAIVDQYALTVEGAAAPWASIDPPNVNLLPDSDTIALLSFQPPRSADTPSGPALFVVRATSREDQSVSETAAGVLMVGSYIDVETAIVPLTSRGKKGAQHEYSLHNRGNGPVSAVLLASDPDKQLVFSADPPVISAEAGESGAATIDVRPARRIWVGTARIHPFAIGAQIEKAPPIRTDGRHEQLPFVPPWVVKVVLLILVPLLALLVYLILYPKLPRVAGETQPAASEQLLDAGFKPRFENVASERPVGIVTETDPPPGRVRRGSEVLAQVSAGPEPIPVPDLRGLDAGVARSQLLTAGLTARTEVQENEDVGPGQVFATEPAAGGLMPPEGQVLMRVREGGNLGGRRGIVDFGPVDPVTGFPAWYQDGSQTGLRLEPCLDGPPLCSAAKDAFVASPPDGLAYYWSAQIVPFNSPLNDGPITFRTGLAAAFGAGGEAGCAPRSCAERTYSVIEVTAEAGALRPEATYVVTHPFGTSTITANSSGAITPELGKEEIGCIPDPGVECQWEAVQSGRVGPFLVWNREAAPDAPAGFVGDGVTPHPVTGSPSGNNSVRITGPGLGEGLVTDQFLVQGKVSVTSAPPPGEAGINPSPLSLTVPPQRAGIASAPQPVALRNHGDGNLRITAVRVEGINNQDWALASQNCTGQTIPAGGTCQVNVTVTPAADGATNGTITIESNAFGAPHTVALSGTGQAPLVEAAPADVDFGTSAAGATSPPKTVTVKNSGTADLVVASAEITGPDSGDFSITGNACNSKVPPGQACAVKLAFRASTGGKRNASLSLAHDAPVGGSRQEIPLTGTGQAPSSKVGPAALVLAPEAPKGTVTLSNGGTTELKIKDIRVEGPGAATFAVGGSCTKGGAVGPGASCAADITLSSPNVLGCTQATLVIVTDDPGAAERRVSLTGKPLLSLGC